MPIHALQTVCPERTSAGITAPVTLWAQTETEPGVEGVERQEEVEKVETGRGDE